MEGNEKGEEEGRERPTLRGPSGPTWLFPTVAKAGNIEATERRAHAGGGRSVLAGGAGAAGAAGDPSRLTDIVCDCVSVETERVRVSVGCCRYGIAGVRLSCCGVVVVK